MIEFDQMERALKGEYREVFSTAKTYAILAHISEATMTDRLTELYDLLFTAQAEGKLVTRVIGTDLERFCKDFFAEFNTLAQVKHFLHDQVLWLCVIFAIELFAILADFSGSTEPRGMNDISLFLLRMWLGSVYVLFRRLVILPRMFKNRKIKPNSWITISIVSILPVFYGAFALKEHWNWTFYVPSVPFALVCGTIIVSYYLLRSLWRYKKYGSIRSEGKQFTKANLWELNISLTEPAELRAWKRTYALLSKTGEVSSEGFLKKLKTNSRISDVALLVLPLLALTPFSPLVFATFENATTAQEIFFHALILLLLIALLYCALWHSALKDVRLSKATRKKLIQECEKTGKSIPAFLAEKLSENT